ncbi:uncharacterized protein LOC127257608 [Andrographis paniculata]|uniref:uncharacterized protein LOC127257608 n=1 Tax=Andrographis paniculata TaxID=175694 RepID=UPI0021E89C6B|nr:uncharacterized protein LOC127257608 [Andrographis paniculata]
MAEVHGRIRGTHRASPIMRWTILQYGYFWPRISQDCIDYAQGCPSCQHHGLLQRTPVEELHSILKLWPFRGWAMDAIGKIHPPSLKGYAFILVATNYFKKWVKVVPLVQFGIPKTITTDQGIVFTSRKLKAFVVRYVIRLGMEDNPRAWNEMLEEALWAYWNAKSTMTGSTPYRLTYGQGAVLPLEIVVPSLRILKQNEMPMEELDRALLHELDSLLEEQFQALEHLRLQKKKAERTFQ